jgi:hypothetical protein
MNDYRESLIGAYDMLFLFQQELMEKIINIAMMGAHSDINDTFEIGDEYIFTVDQFEDSPDVNVQKLVKLYKEVENTMDSLNNLNSLENSEN